MPAVPTPRELRAAIVSEISSVDDAETLRRVLSVTRALVGQYRHWQTRRRRA